MQDYFTHAKHVGDLTRIFLAALEARHVKSRPSLGEKLRTVFAFGKDPTGPGYRLKNGRLDFVDEAAFAQGPGQHPAALRGGAGDRHPDPPRRAAPGGGEPAPDRRPAARASPEANRIFLDLLLSHNNPEGALRLMNEVGVLGAFIPEFGRIVAMMQFNMYHYYTVDEHIIRTISTLSQIERRELAGRPADRHRHHRQGRRPARALRGAALPRHRQGLGPRPLRVSAPRWRSGSARASGSTPRRPSSSSGWCSNHLLMSDIAQKRDLAEPRTVRDFAQAVKSPTRLKLLTVLTVCDIRGVGPGVWNNWKAMLLRGLYAETLEYLTGGSQASSRPEREAAAKAALADDAASPDWSPAEIEAELRPALRALLARLRHPHPRDLRRARAPGSPRPSPRWHIELDLGARRHPGLLRHGRPPRHLRPPRRRAGALRRQRRRRAHLHHDRRHRHRRLLDPGPRRQPLRERPADPAAQRGQPHARAARSSPARR